MYLFSRPVALDVRVVFPASDIVRIAAVPRAEALSRTWRPPPPSAGLHAAAMRAAIFGGSGAEVIRPRRSLAAPIAIHLFSVGVNPPARRPRPTSFLLARPSSPVPVCWMRFLFVLVSRRSGWWPHDPSRSPSQQASRQIGNLARVDSPAATRIHRSRPRSTRIAVSSPRHAWSRESSLQGRHWRSGRNCPLRPRPQPAHLASGRHADPFLLGQSAQGHVVRRQHLREYRRLPFR